MGSAAERYRLHLLSLVARAAQAMTAVPAAGRLITGCAGGVLRDILCNDVPLLFRGESYASASVVTGLFYATGFALIAEQRALDRAHIPARADIPPARDPLQMGHAEIRFTGGQR